MEWLEYVKIPQDLYIVDLGYWKWNMKHAMNPMSDYCDLSAGNNWMVWPFVGPSQHVLIASPASHSGYLRKLTIYV